MEAKKKVKPIKRSTKKKKPAKNARSNAPRLFGSFNDVESWENVKLTPEFVSKIGDLMQQFIDAHDENTCRYQFLTWIGVPEYKWSRWCHRNTKLHKMNDMFVQALGGKRQRHAEYARKYGADSNTIAKTLHKYHPVWKEVHDEAVALKKADEIEANRPIQVILPNITRKKDEN